MSVLCCVRGKNGITCGEIEVGNEVDIDRGRVYCLGIQMPRFQSNEELRRWEWLLLDPRCDTVLPDGVECDGGFARENLHWSHGNARIRGDDNGENAFVLDMEAGYRVHSDCIRELCAVRPTESDNVLGIVVQ